MNTEASRSQVSRAAGTGWAALSPGGTQASGRVPDASLSITLCPLRAEGQQEFGLLWQLLKRPQDGRVAQKSLCSSQGLSSFSP